MAADQQPEESVSRKVCVNSATSGLAQSVWFLRHVVHDVLLGGGAIVSPYGRKILGIQSSHRNTTGIISIGRMGVLGRMALKAQPRWLQSWIMRSHLLCRFYQTFQHKRICQSRVNILRRHCSFAAILRHGDRIEPSACHAVMYHPYVKKAHF